ncbi:MAG: NfeD family protein [Treponema sp.]|jgi:membrane protein implicated in regulation of membrane protease activity|nr:NfeD family protein [Treponema sp.]
MDIYGFILTPWFWLVLMVVFTLIELACSFNLVTMWFAISAFIMIFVSGLTELLDTPIRFRLHLGIFLGLAIVLLVFTRPIAIKKLKVGKVKTNVDDLIGRDALVVKGITKYGKGEVKIRGQIWTAISEIEEEIAENTECVIIRIEGVKAVVRKK